MRAYLVAYLAALTACSFNTQGSGDVPSDATLEVETDAPLGVFDATLFDSASPNPVSVCDSNDDDLVLCQLFGDSYSGGVAVDGSQPEYNSVPINIVEANRIDENDAIAHGPTGIVHFLENAAFNFAPGQEYSYGLWVRAPAAQPSGVRAILLEHFGSFLAILTADRRINCALLFGRGYVSTISPQPIPVDEWTHVTCVIGNESIGTFINGVEVIQTVRGKNDVNLAGSGGLCAGRRCYEMGPNLLTGEPFSGQLDDLKIWSRALSDEAVCAEAAPNCQVQ